MLTEWIVKEKLSQVFNNKAQRILRRGQPKKQMVELHMKVYPKVPGQCSLHASRL